MTMKEKFGAGFTYEDNHKYHQEAVEEYGQEAMAEALTRSTEAFNQVFQSLAENMRQGLPVEASENQEQAGRLLQAIRTYGSTAATSLWSSVKASITQSLRKTSTNSDFKAHTSDVTPLMCD